MDINRSISFIFNDPEWLKKLAIAGLIALIPFVGVFVLLGWGLELTRRVIKEEPESLPDFSDFGGFLGGGFKMFVTQFLLSLPLILIIGCGYGFVVAGAIGASTDNEMMNQMFSGTSAVVLVCLTCLVIPLALLVGLGGQAARGILADTGSIGEALKFGKIIAILKKSLGKYLIAYLVIMLAAFILSPIGGLLCGIGALFTSAFIIAVDAHLMGQCYKFGTEDMPAAPQGVEVL